MSPKVARRDERCSRWKTARDRRRCRAGRRPMRRPRPGSNEPASRATMAASSRSVRRCRCETIRTCSRRATAPASPRRAPSRSFRGACRPAARRRQSAPARAGRAVARTGSRRTRIWRDHRRALRGRVARHSFKAEGAWLWTVKDWIDRRWMRMSDTTAWSPAWRASRPRQGGAAAVARARTALRRALRRRGRRPRGAGRCRGDQAERQAPGADGRFLPRLHGRPICLRSDRREPLSTTCSRWAASRGTRRTALVPPGEGEAGRGDAVPAARRRARLPRPRGRGAGRRPFGRGRACARLRGHRRDRAGAHYPQGRAQGG